MLRLNEDLTEAIALGHDLGHTPFGHAGERVLRELMPGGFNHYEQSLRVVDVLEQDGAGLNLTWEVRNGIAKHSKGKDGAPVGADPALRSATLEGQNARVADIIAYVNHDIDDAVRAGILDAGGLPAGPVSALGDSSSMRIGRMVADVVEQSVTAGETVAIGMSDAVLSATLELRTFLFEAVYENDVATSELAKAGGILEGLWSKIRLSPERFLDPQTVDRDGVDVAACDFLAGMTDRYAISLFEELYVPRPWGRGTADTPGSGR